MFPDPNYQADIADYLDTKAPILCILLDHQGVIMRMNRFAKTIFGPDVENTPFSDLVLDFSGSFSLEAMKSDWQRGYLQNVNTAKGSPRTFILHCYAGRDNLLVLGHEDGNELEMLGETLVEANQELSNLTRKLSVTNKELKRANRKILDLTRKDPLTNLANRRYFAERAAEILSLALRKNEPVSLIMTDIDYFKRVNDRFGHDKGDLVLTGYADLMQENTRHEDLVARFGGEEFIILLPFTDTVHGTDLAERIRGKLERSDFLENGYRITASFGIAQCRTDEDIETTINRADKALYEAKHTGRNRIVVAEDLRNEAESRSS
jgi:diguanylate cyclase (GGDEF)-like protein